MRLSSLKNLDWHIIFFVVIILLSLSNWTDLIPKLTMPYLVGIVVVLYLLSVVLSRPNLDSLKVSSLSITILTTVVFIVITNAILGNISFAANRHLINLTTVSCIYYILIRTLKLDFIKCTTNLANLLLLLTICSVGQYLFFMLFGGGIYDGKGLFHLRHLFGLYLILSSGIILQFAKWKNLYKIAYAIVVVLLICTLGSRITILSAICFTGVFALVHFPKWMTVRNFLIAVVILVLLCIGLYYLRPESVHGRFLLWRIGLSAIEWNHILLGQGIGFVEYKIGAMQANYLQGVHITDRLLAGEVKTVMSEYLRLFLEIGVIGCAGGVYVVARTFRILFANRFFYLIAAFVAILIQSLASYPLSSLPIVLLATVLIAIATTKDHRQNYYTLAKRWRHVLPIPITILLGYIGVLQGFYLYQQHRWSHMVENFDYRYNEPIFLSSYRDINLVLKDEPTFLEDYAVKLQSLSYLEEADEVLNRLVLLQPTSRRYMLLGYNQELQQRYAQAAEAYQMASHILPKSFMPQYLLFDMYRGAGDKERAVSAGLEILRHPIKVPSQKVDEMRADVTEFLNLNYILHEKN